MSLGGWSALILAGGAGQRFGGEGEALGHGGKLLAELGGVPLIRRVADAVCRVGFAEVMAITGAEDAGIRRALVGADLFVSHASDWAEGMAASLRAGVTSLSPQAVGVFIFLGDMPLVPVGLCGALVEAAQASGYAARTRFEGKPGHPVAFTRAAFADLLTLEGDAGATALLKARPEAVTYLDTAERGVLFDIDTPGDLAAAVAAWNA